MSRLGGQPVENPGWDEVVADIIGKLEAGDDQEEVAAKGRRPTVGQIRYLEAVNPTCIFPGCPHPSLRSDLDHNQAWVEDGPTTNPNLGPSANTTTPSRPKPDGR